MNKELLIEKNKTIKSAMNILGKINPKILFVVDNSKLIGTLTDGDIRRYLLAKGSIEDLVYEACNKQPKVAKTIDEAKEKYSKDYIAIPIVDSRKLIVDIYFYDERNINTKYDKLNCPVVINAGGRGSRLEPFTKVLPKPLIPVGDKTIIEEIISEFCKYQCNSFYVIVNYKKELIKAYFKNNSKNYKLKCVDELKPLGTAGGLSLIKNELKNTFFFVNCDTLLVSNYAEILAHHKKTKSDITMVCANKKIEVPFGVVSISKNKELKEIKEKPIYSLLTNVGFYIIEPKLLKDIKNNVSIDMPGFIELEQKKGRKITVYSVDENQWLDMGEIPELKKMIERLKTR